MNVRATCLVAVVLLLACRRDPPEASKVSDGPVATGPCAKLSTLPGRPESLGKIDECEKQLAKAREKDEKQADCIVACVDPAKTWDDYQACSGKCKRTKYKDKLEAKDVENVYPAAVCADWKKLHDKDEKPPMSDADVKACNTALDAMKLVQPDKFACEFQCTLEKKQSWADLVACKDACK